LAPQVDGGAGQRVQRLPLAVPLAAPRPQAGVEVIQRVEVPATTTSPEPDKEEIEEWDLDDLARQVYPLIRRMLVIERERLPR
jgi:hypothetical protein